MQASGPRSSNPVDRSRGLHAISRLAFLALAAAALVPATAAAAGASGASGAELQNYEVRLQVGEGPTQPTCTTNSDGSQTCTVAQSVSFTDKTFTGSVTDKANGKTGTITSTCDMSSQMLMTTNMPASTPGQSRPPTQTIMAASGHTVMSCNWEMSFSDGTMNVVVQGTTTMSQVNSRDAAFHGTLNVNVVAGTGSYAGMVGTGSWNQDQTVPIGGEQGGPGGQGPPEASPHPVLPSGSEPGLPPSGSGPVVPPPGGGSSLHASLRTAVAHAARAASSKTANRLSLRLHHGAARTQIVAPGSTLAAGSTVSLRVASVSHSQCRASASSAGKTVTLGTAVDSEGHGGITFAGPLAARLGPGMWRLSAKCSYLSAGRRLTTAPAVATVHIV